MVRAILVEGLGSIISSTREREEYSRNLQEGLGKDSGSELGSEVDQSGERREGENQAKAIEYPFGIMRPHQQSGT